MSVQILPSLYNEQWAYQDRGHIFNDDIENLINKVSATLKKNSPSIEVQRSPSYNFNYVDNSWNFGRTYYVTQPSHRKEDRKGDNTGMYMLAAIIGGVTMLWSGWQSGKSAINQSVAALNYGEILGDVSLMRLSLSKEVHTAHKQLVFNFVNHTEQLAHLMLKTRNWDLALKVALFVGGTLLFMGAACGIAEVSLLLLSPEALIVAGAVTAVGALSGVLFNKAQKSLRPQLETKVLEDIQNLRRVEKPIWIEQPALPSFLPPLNPDYLKPSAPEYD